MRKMPGWQSSYPARVDDIVPSRLTIIRLESNPLGALKHIIYSIQYFLVYYALVSERSLF